MRLLLLFLLLVPAALSFAQIPPIEPGVSQELAKWRSVQYSNISYKLDLTLEKMSPVLRGHMEIRVTQAASTCAEPNCPPLYIVLDWRKLPGHEKDSTISNVTLNGAVVAYGAQPSHIGLADMDNLPLQARGQPIAMEVNDHLVFHQGVRMGENVITLDFTSPILTSGSAITRYIDKEDGSEYVYSLFVPSDASTAFPVFDQPDLKARFDLDLTVLSDWRVVSNTADVTIPLNRQKTHCQADCFSTQHGFQITKPISTYVFAFAAGPWERVSNPHGVSSPHVSKGSTPPRDDVDSRNAAQHISNVEPSLTVGLRTRAADPTETSVPGDVYVRKSQLAKYRPHAAEVARLRDAAIQYLETYFDYKFPWPKYDLVLIPEFPFGGMEHAGATFLRESSVIFPTEPTKGDEISRANLIFHETAHQWFGDLVTMRWFDDLWLKEGFAEFMAYKTLEKVMPDANAWKVFYERNKQAAYATDSTRGTTPIYQPIANLSAAKSAYGNIVYRKAPSFLRQAEFYLGEDKFQTAVRAFLKNHEYANAGWEDLVGEFEGASGQDLRDWGKAWVTQPGVPVFSQRISMDDQEQMRLVPWKLGREGSAAAWPQKTKLLSLVSWGRDTQDVLLRPKTLPGIAIHNNSPFSFLNYGDYGYGIFLLDDKSRDYVLKHIGEEKDPFLRSMMWGALWDSVREAELDPREYVELVIRQLPTEPDETTTASLLGRVSTALNYYLPAEPDCASSPHVSKGSMQPRDTVGSRNAMQTSSQVEPSLTCGLRTQLEAVLLDRMQHATTAGQRITFYRAFVANAATEHGREVLKQMLAQAFGSQKNHPVAEAATPLLGKEGSPTGSRQLQLRTKDKFDIVTRLIVLGDPDAAKLLAGLEKTETSDDAKRYAYAAHAAFATADNRAKFWNDFVNNKDIPESWIEAAIGPFNSISHPELSQPYLERALQELPNLKRTRKIFFINNWLSAWLSGQRDEQALAIVNKFLADNAKLDNDLRLKVLENVDVIERAVKIRNKFTRN